jgi:hypothetical protein
VPDEVQALVPDEVPDEVRALVLDDFFPYRLLKNW